ncbi:cystine transport system substrate-binding protein [Salinibacillus kushneri]|uniref:Cystine transport system substrate-binding protein n=1 Tax=Salinibacillus kushneri TaxID=237682 RepID=A0A1I0EQS2_9BACI|nr:transporter substrate-binding domain-containing protein [Salinibacillus kushneri]SET47860.1 cystine transport system substrate-binding protein [Salinibacillus kushneri]
MSRKMLTFMLLIILVLFTACGSNEGEREGGQTTKDESSNRWEEIQKAGEIVVGTSGTLYPASYYPEESDKITGYDVEIIKEIAKRLDLDVSFEIMGIDSMLSSLDSGRIDLVANDIEITKERQKNFAFSKPYKYSFSTMIVREEDLSDIHSLEDLEGKKAGGGATTVFSDIARHFGAEVVTYTNATNDVYLRDVEKGRTDLVINDYYLQSLALKALPEIEVTLHPDLLFHPTEQAFVMPKDAEILTKIVNQVLAEMREDGTLTDLSKEFFGGKDASNPPEEDVQKIEGLEL